MSVSRQSNAMADFKYGVTFNTHGNTYGSVNPSPSTQSKMLTSRPTQMLAMVLHFLKMCVLGPISRKSDNGLAS